MRQDDIVVGMISFFSQRSVVMAALATVNLSFCPSVRCTTKNPVLRSLAGCTYEDKEATTSSKYYVRRDRIASDIDQRCQSHRAADGERTKSPLPR